MSDDLKLAVATVLDKAVAAGVPGAVATDLGGPLYEGAAGVRPLWGTQVYPYADPASVGGYLEFETAVYDRRPGRRAA